MKSSYDYKLFTVNLPMDAYLLTFWLHWCDEAQLIHFDPCLMTSIGISTNFPYSFGF